MPVRDHGLGPCFDDSATAAGGARQHPFTRQASSHHPGRTAMMSEPAAPADHLYDLQLDRWLLSRLGPSSLATFHASQLQSRQ
jgi:hypothetical protein